MAKKIELPRMSESVDAGTVLSVLVSEGDSIEEGDGLIEVETDKATTEIPSPEAGVVREIRVEEGEEVQVGQVILTLDSDGEEEASEEEPAEEEAEERDEAAESQPEARKEEKKQQQQKKGKGKEQQPRKPAKEREESPAAGGGAPSAARERSRVFASPTVRRLARELGVDPDEVAGSGEGGQVSAADVKAHVRALLARGQRGGIGEAAELPDFAAWGEIERQPMGTLRRRTAEIVRHAWREVPHVTQFDHADVTELRSFREQYREPVEADGGRLTLTVILVKVVAGALEHFPHFNASVDPARAELILKRYVHVGVAVDTDAGLLVPVLRDANEKSLTQIAIELPALAEKAREGRIEPDELQGASFSITNLGSLGTTRFSPIVPWPQVAILAVGRAEPVVVRHDGELVERMRLPIGVSYDHRCVDGADAARFLRWIAEVLEEPMRMTMEPATD